MGAALSLRGDMPAEELRRLARLERDGRVACRLMALANALDGMSRDRAAKQAGMDRQTLRDWVIRFNATGVEGLGDRPRKRRALRTSGATSRSRTKSSRPFTISCAGGRRAPTPFRYGSCS